MFATRETQILGNMSKYVEVGVSPRATIGLNLASKAYAYLQGRHYVTPDDVQEVLSDVFAHRIALNYEAEADGVSQEDIVKKIIQSVPVNN